MEKEKNISESKEKHMIDLLVLKKESDILLNQRK